VEGRGQEWGGKVCLGSQGLPSEKGGGFFAKQETRKPPGLGGDLFTCTMSARDAKRECSVGRIDGEAAGVEAIVGAVNAQDVVSTLCGLCKDRARARDGDDGKPGWAGGGNCGYVLGERDKLWQSTRRRWQTPYGST
jgi:hypothetical protein